jgi:hypothetical protein
MILMEKLVVAKFQPPLDILLDPAIILNSEALGAPLTQGFAI